MFRLPRALAELRDASPALGLLLVHSEHPGLVAVQRHRLAVLLEVRAHRREVGEGRLRLAEQQPHQGAGGIVHEHQQGAARSTLLEPLVVAAVDLDELAATRPTAPGLLDPRLAASPGDPQAVLDHPVPERLDREPQGRAAPSASRGPASGRSPRTGFGPSQAPPGAAPKPASDCWACRDASTPGPRGQPARRRGEDDAPAGSSGPASSPPHTASAASRSPARSRARDPAPRSSCSLSPCPRGYRRPLEKADISTLEKPDISKLVLQRELVISRVIGPEGPPLILPLRGESCCGDTPSTYVAG